MRNEIAGYARRGAHTCLPIGEISGFVRRRFDEVRTTRDLVHFHTINKYLLMSYDPRLLGVLGNIAANHEKNPVSRVIGDYRLHLDRILARSPSTRSHANTLYHILGHFSKGLERDERQAMVTLIGAFRDGSCPLTAVLSVMRDLTARLDKTYLVRQTYFLLFLNSYGSGQSVSAPP